MARQKSLTPEEQEEPAARALIINDLLERLFGGQSRRLAQWATRVNEQAAILASATPTPSASVAGLWVGLYGIIAEILPWAKKAQADAYEDTDPDHPTIPAIEAIVLVLEKLAARFTVDELLFIEVHRQYHAHVFVGAFSHAPGRHGQVDFAYTSKLAGREIPRKEIQDAVARVLEAHGDEARVAVAFATRVRADLCELEAVMKRWALIA